MQMIGTVASKGTFLEYIEMGNHNELDGDAVLDRGEGEFLVLERFYSFSREDRDGLLVLIYGVQGRLTPEEFYGMIGMRSSGPCTADDISDHLVRAFDRGVVSELGLDRALFAYRAPCGRIIHQHST
jgi:hypothetical protein